MTDMERTERRLCLCAEIKRYRELVRRNDPATREKRRLAHDALAPALPPARPARRARKQEDT